MRSTAPAELLATLDDVLRRPVISAEDLVATKILAGRPKDIEDARSVLLERIDRLDLASIRETLRLLEEALSVSDLVPAFEAEVARVRRRPTNEP